MCVNKQYSVCCTLWCAFGTVFLTLFYFLGHYDGPCVSVRNSSKCNGNYFIAGVTDANLTSQKVGDLFGGAALGYLFCSLLAGGFWVYYDYVKKPMGKRRYAMGAVTTAEDVEFSGACVRAGCACVRECVRVCACAGNWECYCEARQLLCREGVIHLVLTGLCRPRPLRLPLTPCCVSCRCICCSCVSVCACLPRMTQTLRRA
jgi:hypothetical protein